MEGRVRWRILRILLWKEALRHVAQRGGIVLGLLLVAAALLMTLLGRDAEKGRSLLGGVEWCYIDHWQDDAWVRHLRQSVPEEMRKRIRFRNIATALGPGETITYPKAAGAIQIRPLPGEGQPRFKIWLWHPDEDGSSLAPFEAWFWRATSEHFREQAAAITGAAAVELVQERSQLRGGVDMRTSIAAALILFALFFSCVYLLPALMCEERERGVLLAQALSPASPLEIFAAKLLFYPGAGIGLALLLTGITRPQALAQPLFWMTLVAAAMGSLGIGLTIASLARTQRGASMGALCYVLVLAMFLFICQQMRVPFLSWLALEYHVPRLLHAAMADAVFWYHGGNLIMSGVLAAGWLTAALILFRRCGWQS
jgi:hypothetical protein